MKELRRRLAKLPDIHKLDSSPVRRDIMDADFVVRKAMKDATIGRQDMRPIAVVSNALNPRISTISNLGSAIWGSLTLRFMGPGDIP